MNGSCLCAILAAGCRTLRPFAFAPLRWARGHATLFHFARSIRTVAQTFVRPFQCRSTVACDCSRMSSTATAYRTWTECRNCPGVRVWFGVMGRRFWHTVFIVDTNIRVLIEKHQIDWFVRGAKACDVIGCGESLWTAIVMPNRSGKCQWTRKIDAPITIQIIMASGIANGQVVVRWRSFLDFDICGSFWDQENVVVACEQRDLSRI